jgi:WD40 repeat protein
LSSDTAGYGYVWTARSGCVLNAIRGPAEPPGMWSGWGGAISPDDRLAVTVASSDSAAHVDEVGRPRALLTLRGSQQDIEDAAFSPDSSLPATISGDGVRLRTQLDTATAIEALLFAAGELDAEAQEHPQSNVRLLPRRAIVATLLLSGPRIGELVDDRWADVDLANDRIQYDSKTPAGCRWVRLLPALHDGLATLKGSATPPPMTMCSGRRAAASSQSRISATAC